MLSLVNGFIKSVCLSVPISSNLVNSFVGVGVYFMLGANLAGGLITLSTKFLHYPSKIPKVIGTDRRKQTKVHEANVDCLSGSWCACWLPFEQATYNLHGSVFLTRSSYLCGIENRTYV